MFLTIKENEQKLRELAWKVAIEAKPSMHPEFKLFKEEGDFTIDLRAALFFSNGNNRKIEFIKLGEKERDEYNVLEEMRKAGYWPYFSQYFMRHEYWSHKDIEAVESLPLNSEGLEEAFKIALRILEKINSLAKGRIQVLKMASVPTSPAVDQKVWFCSGPLRNGTEDGSYRNENLKIFFKKLHEFSKNHLVFDQLPFDRFIEKLIASGFSTETIFQNFFGRIIRSGYIDSICMFEGWEKSGGATFENKVGIECQLHIEDENGVIINTVENIGHF